MYQFQFCVPQTHFCTSVRPLIIDNHKLNTNHFRTEYWRCPHIYNARRFMFRGDKVLSYQPPPPNFMIVQSWHYSINWFHVGENLSNILLAIPSWSNIPPLAPNRPSGTCINIYKPSAYQSIKSRVR